jgi:hypothetical protein
MNVMPQKAFQFPTVSGDTANTQTCHMEATLVQQNLQVWNYVWHYLWTIYNLCEGSSICKM